MGQRLVVMWQRLAVMGQRLVAMVELHHGHWKVVASDMEETTEVIGCHACDMTGQPLDSSESP